MNAVSTGSAACRFCGASLAEIVADLGMSPLSNAYVEFEAAHKPELFYPLTAFVCDRCLLVQVPAVETPERIFGDYAYFSSYSDSWLAHSRRYATRMRRQLGLGPRAQIVEVGSNDGYLLQYFQAEGIPVLGVEPATNVADVARAKGIETLTAFFGTQAAHELERRATLLVANNVMPHVPDLNDFVEGLRIVLAPGGLLTAEFPHLLQLMRGGQFDTIYHEHFSYFTVSTVRAVLAAHDLRLVDVEELPTHGGSLRIHVRHEADDVPVESSVETLIEAEQLAGLDRIETYRRFAEAVRDTRRSLLLFLLEARDNGAQVAGYGAPAKASTLLNYCGVGRDFIAYTVDRNPYKQGRFLPGTRIPIHAPERLAQTRPDYVVILPWNLRDEITAQLAHVRHWGGRLVIPVPQVEVLA